MSDAPSVEECKANVLEFLNAASDVDLLAFMSAQCFRDSQGLLIVRKALIAWVSLAKDDSCARMWCSGCKVIQPIVNAQPNTQKTPWAYTCAICGQDAYAGVPDEEA